MKQIFTLLLLICFSANFAQTHSIVGKWKVIAAGNDEIYKNMETDSIFLSDAFGDKNSKVAKRKVLLFERMYFQKQFSFDDNKNFVAFYSNNPKKTGIYKVDSSKKILTIITDGPKSVEEIYEYSFTGSNLNLRKVSGEKIVYTLRKQE